MSEFELIIKKLEIVRDTEENGCYICDKEHSKILLDGINKQKEIIDKLTAESTEWEERTYCWQDRAENLQIVLDKIKEYTGELLSDTKGIINDLEYHKKAHKRELELLYDDKDIFNNILELLEEIEK